MPATLIPSPIRGWNTRDPIAAMEPGYAPILDNFVITGGVPEVRAGWRVWATGLPGRVDGLLSFTGAGVAQQLFAASGTGIYAINSTGPVGAAAVTGLTSARWSGINVAATGGNFLFAFNGVDAPRTFDGTTWAAWGGTGVTGGVSWAGQVGGRLLVGNQSRLSFFYGGAGAIGGAFTEFPLQGVATRGGGVCAVASLSFDGGNGPQTLTVILTTEGEAVVYSGIDPSSVSTWSLVGRWRLPRPVGAPHRCVAAFGGEALIMTEAGVIPLSSLRSGEDAGLAMERAGNTRAIAPTWRDLVRERVPLTGWSITALSGLDLIVLNVPWSGTTAQQIVVSQQQALSRWNGVPAACWIEGLNGRVFFGDAGATGRVMLYGEDDGDGGAGISSEAMTHYSGFNGGAVKRAQLVQPIMRDAGAVTLNCAVLANWDVPTPIADAAGATATAPPAPMLPGGGGSLIWGAGAWDSGLWGGGSGTVSQAWQSAVAVGHAMAIRIDMVSGITRPSWLGSHLVFESGGPVR